MSSLLKSMILLCSCILILTLSPTLFSVGASREEAVGLQSELTPALQVIAEQFPLIRSGLVGEEICFSPKDFDSLLGVKRVSEILISSLPPKTAGTLMLGEETVVSDQVIPRSRISSLRYLPVSGEESEAVFTFRIQGSEEYELTCSLYQLKAINYRPDCSALASSPPEIVTYRNVATHRRLHAADPENDRLSFEVVDYPEKGILVITDREEGSCRYTPVLDFVGSDSFSYRVRDAYGNLSDERTVSVRVEENEASVVYSDLIGDAVQYPALRLTAADILDVQYENGAAVFKKEEAVSRLDFLIMAMKASGYRVSTGVSATPFVDDEDIPEEWKGYVTAAVNLGFLHGVMTDKGLYCYPNATITRTEAAVILNRMLKPSLPVSAPVFSDSQSIPAYALEAFHALGGAGVLEAFGSTLEPDRLVDRGDAATLLSAAMDHVEREKRSDR